MPQRAANAAATLGRALLVCALVASAPRAFAQSAENVLLVINGPSAASVQIGEHYARVRTVPQDNVLRLECDQSDQVTRAVYERQIERPIANWISRNAAHDRILYIVLTKGIPLRVAGSGGRQGTVASVDSELTLLYRKLSGRPIAPQGAIANPYFHAARAIEEAKPFTHEAFDIYLVTRLDGFTVADAIALIDRGAAPVRTGRFILDEKFSLKVESGNQWLAKAAERLRTAGLGDRVLLDTTTRVITQEADVLGYYSWGSNDSQFKDRHTKLGFVAGSLAAAFVSTDARTFKEPPAAWTLGTWENAKTHYAGSPQSLVGDLIREGATGAAGHVAEPFLDATIRPDILFPAYVAGFNLAESFYLAMPSVSWQTVVIGDPLCAPFRTHVMTSQEIHRGVDQTTELPALFSARMLQPFASRGASPEAVKLFIRAKSRMARADVKGAQQALEQATALDAKFGEAQANLAELYENAKEFDKAIERYRRVLAVTPANVIALNNLAFLMAVQKHDLGPETLDLAQKAYRLAPVPSVADTLAWILHLAGADTEARVPMAQALKGSPESAPIQLHAAIIDAAVGAPDLAARELARALELDPQLEKDPDVQQLRAKLAPKKR
jgi:uncharacterized protein (TIGR03790 family)